ncbi:MAG: hypothetical protein US70_C0030G0007 [Parcubacteria group bacterium GW2011_GWD2_38_11]|nr:MAG: hypothetical protein US70_C0030G0007 [Parcubacteria group bacterium GW2011_GWD2_38_11]
MSETKRFFVILLAVIVIVPLLFFIVTYPFSAYLKVTLDGSQLGIANVGSDYYKDFFFVYKNTCNSGYGCILFTDVKLVKGANSKTFSCFSGTSSYCKDDKHIFYEGEIFSGVDMKTFVVLAPDIAKDKNNVYQGSDIYKIADAASFQENGYCHFKDVNNSYACKQSVDSVFDQLEIVPTISTINPYVNNINREGISNTTSVSLSDNFISINGSGEYSFSGASRVENSNVIQRIDYDIFNQSNGVMVTGLYIYNQNVKSTTNELYDNFISEKKYDYPGEIGIRLKNTTYEKIKLGEYEYVKRTDSQGVDYIMHFDKYEIGAHIDPSKQVNIKDFEKMLSTLKLKLI